MNPLFDVSLLFDLLDIKRDEEARWVNGGGRDDEWIVCEGKNERREGCILCSG